MRTSQYLLATVKETPADAEIVSHQLMVRAGLIRKLASGLYSWLPLGFRVLNKVTQIVHPVDKSRKADLLSHCIKEEGWFQVLVFVKTKRGANKLSQQLIKKRINAAAFHGMNLALDKIELLKQGLVLLVH